MFGFELMLSDFLIFVLRIGKGFGCVWCGLCEEGWFIGVVMEFVGLYFMV